MNVRIDYSPGGGGKPPRRTTQQGDSGGRAPAKRPWKRQHIFLLGAVGVGVVAMAAALVVVPGERDKGREDSGGEPGSSASSGPSDAPGLKREAATAVGESGSKRIGGIPRGFPHTETGAVEAAITASANSLQMLRLPKDQRGAYVKDVFVKAPAGYEERAKLWRTQNNVNDAGELVDLATGKADANKRFTSLCHPELGAYKVESHTVASATVTVWNPCLTGTVNADGFGELQTQWFLGQFDLRWAKGDWRVAKTGSGSYGANAPSPPGASGRPAISYAERAQLLRPLGGGWSLTADATTTPPAELREGR